MTELFTKFLTEWLFVAGATSALGLVGGFATIPFRGRVEFALLLAPLMGLALLSIGSGVLYVLAGLPVLTAAGVTTSLGAVGTIAILARLRPTLHRGLVFQLAIGGLVSALVAAITTAPSIKLGSPALLYMDGTDHLGYVHIADWLLMHTTRDIPRANPAYPYESFPNYVLISENRFGSFAVLAVIATLRGVSPTFAYDPASAVVLSTGILGVAAVFSRTKLTLGLLALGLLTCWWYDYTRSGFFGKVLGFPLAIGIIGLVLMGRDRLSVPQLW